MFFDMKLTENECVLVSTGRDPWEDLAYSLCGRSSLGDWDNHRGKQSNKKSISSGVHIDS